MTVRFADPKENRAHLWLSFQAAKTTRERILVKREAYQQGELELVGVMLACLFVPVDSWAGNRSA